MYHIIVFQKTNEVEVAAVKWVEERSMWPSAAAGCVTTTFTSSKYFYVCVVSSDTSTHITGFKSSFIFSQTFVDIQLDLTIK